MRTDNGGEFRSKSLDDYLKSNGIWHEKPFRTCLNKLVLLNALIELWLKDSVVRCAEDESS